MKKTTSGFTIIEVSLVLVIGGLIFMMVFFALPQMRRQQRDTERKDDVMMLVEAIKKFQTNNRGALPGTVGNTSSSAWTEFMQLYVDENYGATDGSHKSFVDPTGEDYNLSTPQSRGNNTPPSYDSIPYDHTMYIYTQATCDDTEQKAKQINNPRDFVVLYRTESTGVYCQSS